MRAEINRETTELYRLAIEQDISQRMDSEGQAPRGNQSRAEVRRKIDVSASESGWQYSGHNQDVFRKLSQRTPKRDPSMRWLIESYDNFSDVVEITDVSNIQDMLESISEFNTAALKSINGLLLTEVCELPFQDLIPFQNVMSPSLSQVSETLKRCDETYIKGIQAVLYLCSAITSVDYKPSRYLIQDSTPL